jgi:hypothetical protein
MEKFDYIFGFSVKRYVRNTINLSWDKILLTSVVGGIFCDLTKAFDSVDHDILLSKFEKYEITGKGKELMQSYIKGRYQRVITNDKANHKTFV